ncbi:hypothetical protein Q8A73_022553 [Channa argus]|nr:hypothetical protein Q8A73_022553 [Channa argus]
MVSAGRQILGVALAIIGFLVSIIICGLPMWRVTLFIGSNIVIAQTIWEDLQAAKALVVIAIIVGIFGILLSIVGGKCTNLIKDEKQKCKVAIAAGVTFLIAGLLVLVPVCWTANTIIRDFYDVLLIDAQRRELGASLYIGWGAAGLLLLGGGILCSSCPSIDDHVVKYTNARPVKSSRGYV